MAIGTRAMPAGRTRLRGVGRINHSDLDARPGRFIRKEQAQLVEGPGMPFVTVFAANRDSLSQASEVFQGECLARYDSFLDQGLRDPVVDITHPAPLAPAHPLQAPFGGTSPYTLQSGPAGDITTAFLAHKSTCKLLPFAIGCHVHEAQVDADGPMCRLLQGTFRGRFLESRQTGKEKRGNRKREDVSF